MNSWYYTNNVAMKNEWYEIPLWDGLSLGYVHSLKFAKPSEIDEEFEQKYGVGKRCRF